MEQVGLNLLADLFSDKIAMAGNGPTDPGNQLFRGLLEKSVHSGKGAGMAEMQGGAQGPEEPETGAAMLAGLQRVGLPMGQLRLPRSAVPDLIRLLERQGFQRDEIRSLIASLSDKDGSIRMDRLLARLSKNERPGRGQQDLVIQAKDIPAVGEALAAMGLGAGKIKEVIESALNQKGELSLEKLTGALSATVPGQDMKTILPSILERARIQGAAKIEPGAMADPEVKRLVKDLSDSPGQDGQRQIREEIARLLRDKGLPPQEVKNFLETLTAGHAKSLTMKGAGDPDALKKAEADAKEIAGKVVLGAERRQPLDEWREKILQILQKEKSGKEPLQKNWFHEEGPLKPSPGEQVKPGEPKPRAVAVDPVRSVEGRHSSVSEQPQARGVRKENPADSRSGIPKEVMPSDLSAVRIRKESVEPVSAARSKDAVALPDPLPKILDRMLWMIQGGEQKGRIHISPPELGRLDLDLVIKHGHLQAQLSAENPQVKELIEANLGQLKQHLADMGLVIDRFDVMVGLEQNPFSREQAWTAGNRRGGSSRKDGEAEAPLQPEPAAPVRRGHSMSQIDVHV
jgi:flagellar hook-length control protein FliK